MKKIQIGYFATDGHHEKLSFFLNPPEYSENSGCWSSDRGGQCSVSNAREVAKAYGISLTDKAVYPAYVWLDTKPVKKIKKPWED